MPSRKTIVAALALAGAGAEDEAGPQPLTVLDGAHFFEGFQTGWDRWTKSSNADYDGEWKHEAYASPEGIPGDKGLVVGSAAKKHAISVGFPKPLDPKVGGLVVQYELQLKDTLTCGGAYLKLLTAGDAPHDAVSFDGNAPYTLMFGPDRCGDTNKVHFIIRFQSPVTKEWEEKHLVAPPAAVGTHDKQTHLYTAIVGTDNSVKILIDNKEVKTVSLTSDSDFAPPINPPKEINDPSDAKPSDWVDTEKIDDPAASKPDDWDEDEPRTIADPSKSKPETWLDDAPLTIPDPTAVQPADWDADEDGEWEAPLVKNPDCEKYGCGEWVAPTISNPKYKGKWSAPKVDNPEYKGPWVQKTIANPGFYVDEAPYKLSPIGALGIELWTMQSGLHFDNILVGADAAAAAEAAKTWLARNKVEKKAQTQAQRENLVQEPGLLGKIKYNAKKGLYYAQDNAVLVGVSLFLGLLPILLYCCLGGSKKEPADDSEQLQAQMARLDARAKERTREAEGTEGAGASSEGEAESRVEDVTEPEAPKPKATPTSSGKKKGKRTSKAAD